MTNCHSNFYVWTLILSIIFLYCNAHIKQCYHVTLTWVGSCSVASPVRKRKMYFNAGFEMNSFQSSLSVRIKVGFTHGACIYKISLEVNNTRWNLTYPYSHLPLPQVIQHVDATVFTLYVLLIYLQLFSCNEHQRNIMEDLYIVTSNSSQNLLV